MAVNELWHNNPGDSVELEVGGRLQPAFNPALSVNGKLLQKQQTRSFGKVIALDLGAVKLVLTEGHAMPVKPHFYEDLGLSVKSADIVITKSFFHFKLFYLAHSRKTLYVKTHGITDFERVLELALPYPAYPKDDIVDWRAVDAHKRRVKVPEHQNKEEPTVSYSPARHFSRQSKRTTKKHWFWALLSLATLAHVAYHQENSLTFWKPKKRKTSL